MSVADVTAALAPFSGGIEALFGAALALYLVRSVLRWFRDLEDGA